jgi:hypothetical protein
MSELSDAGLVPMLRLDLMTLRPMARLVGIGSAMSLALAAFGGSGMGLGFVAMLATLLTTNLISDNQVNPLDRLYCALPLSRRTVVRSHYLMIAALAVLSVPLMLLACLAARLTGQGSFQNDAALAPTTGIVLIFLLALLVPAVVRFGSQKATFALFGAIMAFSALLMALERTLDLRPAAVWILTHVALVDAIAILPAAGLLALSYLVSLRIYVAQDH